MIPRLDNTIKYINSELDEMDRYVSPCLSPVWKDNTCREEFFRLKKVQGKKKRDAEKNTEGRKDANDAYQGGGGHVHRDDGVGGGAGGGGDMLDDGKDEDVIF